MTCCSLIGSTLFSFWVAHQIKVHIPPFGILEVMKYSNKHTYFLVVHGLSNTAMSQGGCEKAYVTGQVWSNCLQIRELLSHYHDWWCFPAPGIGQPLYFCSSSGNFIKVAPWSPATLMTFFMRWWCKQIGWGGPLNFFVIGNRFLKESENYCFEESKTQVSWGLAVSLSCAYDIAAVRVYVIRWWVFSRLHHEVLWQDRLGFFSLNRFCICSVLSVIKGKWNLEAIIQS